MCNIKHSSVTKTKCPIVMYKVLKNKKVGNWEILIEHSLTMDKFDYYYFNN